MTKLMPLMNVGLKVYSVTLIVGSMIDTWFKNEESAAHLVGIATLAWVMSESRVFKTNKKATNKKV